MATSGFRRWVTERDTEMNGARMLVEELLASAPTGCRILARQRDDGSVEFTKLPQPREITVEEIARIEGVSARTVRRKYLDTRRLVRRGGAILRKDYTDVVSA